MPQGAQGPKISGHRVVSIEALQNAPQPGLPIDARCCPSLQGEVALPKQIDSQMMQQRRELFRLPLLCSLTHTAQPLGHTYPALCRARVRLRDVLLDLRSSLPHLRRRSPALVRLVHRYYTRVRLLRGVHIRRAVYGLPGPARRFLWRHGGLPVLVHEVSQRARGLRLRGTRRRLAMSPLPVWPSTIGTVSASRLAFSKLHTRPTDAAVYASQAASRRPAQNSRSGWNRYLLSCETLSFSTSCRFIPAHPNHAQSNSAKI